MLTYKNCFRPVVLAAAMALGPVLAVADDCGEVPAAPEIIDGATATMEALVANSEEVKAYIAAADGYLDCREAIAKSDDFKDLPAAEQQAQIAANAQVLETRNKIGDDFNAEVGAYKAANP